MSARIPPTAPGPLDDELASLFAAERRHPGPSAEARDRVRAAVLGTVAAGVAVGAGAATASTTASTTAATTAATTALSTASTTATSAITSSAAVSSAVTTAAAGAAGTAGAANTAVGGALLGGTAKTGLALAAAIAATAGGGVFVATYEVAPEAAHVATEDGDDRGDDDAGGDDDADADDGDGERPVPTGPSGPGQPDVAASEPSPPPPPRGARSARSTPPTTTPTPSPEDLAAERGLIATARSALQADDGTGALLALTAHGDRFPRGLLAEERDALRVVALARVGRPSQARAAGERFLRTYPRSLFREAVSQALSGLP